MQRRTVLITGCSAGGIGHSFAKEFERNGFTVFATARTKSKMSSLEESTNIHLLELDVTSTSDIATAVKEVISHTGGRLDYLVNNSGQFYLMPALDTDMQQARKLFDVNFWGVLSMVQAFAPLLIAARGTIVNIGSIQGNLHTPYASIYNASKAAIHMFDETLRIELAPLNVKVLTVVTGSVSTSIHSNLPSTKLPEDSKYLPAQDMLNQMAQANDGIVRISSDVFAAKTVRDILGGARGKVWRGNYASLVWFCTSFLPMFILDRIVVKGRALDKIAVAGGTTKL